jgi:hypothetical protein
MIFVHGAEYDRETAAREAQALCEKFLDRNSIRHPKFAFLHGRDVNTYGRYYPGSETVQVYVNRCRLPSTNNYSWSWPGYTADVTVLGVTAHEVGHHVENVRGWRAVINEMYDILHKERGVSGYAQFDRHEDFSEAMKLMITNPSLLEALCPLRYAHFVGKLGISPVETRHWSEILCDSPRHLKAVRNKL